MAEKRSTDVKRTARLAPAAAHEAGMDSWSMPASVFGYADCPAAGIRSDPAWFTPGLTSWRSPFARRGGPSPFRAKALTDLASAPPHSSCILVRPLGRQLAVWGSVRPADDRRPAFTSPDRKRFSPFLSLPPSSLPADPARARNPQPVLWLSNPRFPILAGCGATQPRPCAWSQARRTYSPAEET